jgi:cbb3-type cytochrome oxidase cytochrome c subunit
LERFSFVFLVAGLFFFALAFAISAVIPMMSVADLDVRTVEQLASQPPYEFALLSEQYPEAYEKAFGDMSETEAFAEALRTGHKTYIGEACWHCHSQQVRPWGGDEARYGPKSFPEEYHNELNMPPLWGTRRIGPDLIRRGGRQSNDWHMAHFYNPPDVNAYSVMPAYPWFFEDDGLTPNKKGLSIVAYVQWLGSWLPRNDETLFDIDSLSADYRAPVLPAPPVVEGAADDSEEAGQEDFWGEE